MDALKGFILDVRNSFFGPTFYTAVRVMPLSKVLLFLYFVALAASVVTVGSAVIAMLPEIAKFKEADFVATHYPDGLEVTVKDGVASTNAEEPFIVPIPEEDRAEAEGFTNYFVIDTRPDVTVETLNSYAAMAVLTRDSFILKDDNDGRIVPLKTMGEVLVTEEIVTKWVDSFLDILLVLLVPLVILMFAFVAMFITLGHMIASLFGGLVVMLLGRLKKLPLAYGEAYKTAVVASIPLILIGTVAFFFGFPVLPFFIDFFIFLAIVLANLEESPTESAG